MNHDFLIKTTNKVALWATIALFYWVFIFICITVFDLKVFRENITETFFMSVLGIFSLLGGALVLNVMSNLSKISSSVQTTEAQKSDFKNMKWWLISLPVIFGLLFIGNMLSTNEKERKLVASALSVIQQNPEYSHSFANYSFDKSYIKETAEALKVINKIDKFFPHALVIQRDSIQNRQVFLKFSSRDYFPAQLSSKGKKTEGPLLKQDFIFTTGKDERAYLTKVFNGQTDKHLFTAHKNRYELFYPVIVDNKRFVMYFSDYQRYGKIGS